MYRRSDDGEQAAYTLTLGDWLMTSSYPLRLSLVFTVYYPTVWITTGDPTREDIG